MALILTRINQRLLVTHSSLMVKRQIKTLQNEKYARQMFHTLTYTHKSCIYHTKLIYGNSLIVSCETL